MEVLSLSFSIISMVKLKEVGDFSLTFNEKTCFESVQVTKAFITETSQYKMYPEFAPNI